VPHTFAERVDKDHGRVETRRCWAVGDLACLGEGHGWPQAKTLAVVEAVRDINGTASVERRYYISPLDADAERMGAVVRGHWGVENGLHWVLDVAYGEDQARMREGNSAENFSILRRITLNLVKQDKSVKVGVKNRRLLAGWDDAYREKLLGMQAFA
jgi:predicted transposase YbfD/YdcC